MILHEAVLKNDISTVKKLVQIHYDLRGTNKLGQTALMLSKSGSMTKLLASAMGGIDQIDNKGKNALYYARSAIQAKVLLGKYIPARKDLVDNERHKPQVKKLIQDYRDKLTKQLQIVVPGGDVKNAKWALDHGADVNCPEHNLLLSAYDPWSMATMLMDYGADVNAKAQNGWTALIHLSHYGNEMGVAKALELGAPLNDVDNLGNSAVMHAVENNNTEILKLLIGAGCDLNIKDNQGKTALYKAIRAYYKNPVEVDLLIDAGADVNIPSNNGWTPLISGVTLSKMSCVNKLIKAGSDLNAVDQYGDTALIKAVLLCLLPMINKLLECGADFTIKNENGETALDIARQKNLQDIVRLIEQHDKREKRKNDAREVENGYPMDLEYM